MKTVLLLICLFASVFSTSAFARGGHGSGIRYTKTLNGVEISGPFVVEVDYTVPLDILIMQVPQRTSARNFPTFLEYFSKKYFRSGKMRREIYLVHAVVETMPSVEFNAKAANNTIHLNDESFLSAVEKMAGNLTPAGPYELFSYSIKYGKTNGAGSYGYTSFHIMPIAVDVSSWGEFRTTYTPEGRVDIIARPSEYDQNVWLGNYVLFMK